MKYIAGLFLFALVTITSYVFIPIDVYAASDVCYCVLYLRQELGVDIRGNANTIRANISQAYIEPGDVVLFHYPGVDHVALITDVIQQVLPQRPGIYITIQESNFHHCTPDSRTIPLDDPAIRGIFRAPLSTD